MASSRVAEDSGSAPQAFRSTAWLGSARRVRGQALPFHCGRLFVASRARSGRSGWASSPALRPAFACDRAGTARRADPRCSSPALCFGSASISTRRSGRSVPARSGAMAPVARGADFTTTLPFAGEPAQAVRRDQDSRVAETPIPTSGGGFNLPVPRVASLSEARGHRMREPRWGDGGAASRERRGAPMRIAPSGRGRRSVRPQRLGRRKATPSHPRDRQQEPSRRDKDESNRAPAGQEKSFTQRKGRLLSAQVAAGLPRAQACQGLAHDDVSITRWDFENHRQRCATFVRQELAEERLAQPAFARRGVAVAV